VHTLALDVIDNLRVMANGCLLELEIMEGAGTTVRQYRGQIPASVTARNPHGPVRLVFSVNRTLSFQSLNLDNPDERQVGIALNWVRVQPFLSSG
jgi:hypothetical protein